MVTCRMVDTVPNVTKMNSTRALKPLSSSNSSGFRLLDHNQLEANSSVSKNSVYKLKIDLMFDDTRSASENRLNDTGGSHRTRSIIMYGRSELAGTERSTRSISSLLQELSETKRTLSRAADPQNDVKRISNSVQEQIEQLFTEVARDATSSFPVVYLGSLPLKEKVTSLQGLQTPLRELYLKEMNAKCSGLLEICATGLQVKISSRYGMAGNDENITPFHNIAVWSAVKFVESKNYGGAAFLPLITDPDNIDKSTLFRPLCGAEKTQAANQKHAPIFAVVMRSSGLPKSLKCHAFICKCTQDAIVIAATLYQSLMAHVTNSHRSTKARVPRNQNGVSCISIASSSARTGSNYLSNTQAALLSGRKSSAPCSTSDSFSAADVIASAAAPRSSRRKRLPTSVASGINNCIHEVESTTEERKVVKSHKTKRAPPIPHETHPNAAGRNKNGGGRLMTTGGGAACGDCGALGDRHLKVTDSLACAGNSASGLRGETNGDILTRVAIPRSGSFLNTGGLTRYKSRAMRRRSGNLGGGGGSPLGFSELFNEFRLHENLHSLDEILYAIIDADGMSFNDLKPIYKEFLLKLAVTLTKDELFQHSKNIMRRQRKKKLKRRNNMTTSVPPQEKLKSLIFCTKNFKKVFRFDQFRSCRGKPLRGTQRNATSDNDEDAGAQIHCLMDKLTGNKSTCQPMPSHGPRGVPTISGSDGSIAARNDNNHHQLHGFHRHSSSGYVAGTTSYLTDYNDCYCSYVSCSECSYDSESCTCTSAERCYCSFRTEQHNTDTNPTKLRRNGQQHNNNTNNDDSGNDSRERTKLGTSIRYAGSTVAGAVRGGGGGGGGNINRDSLISCKSDEKCYCSMAEADEVVTPDDSGNNQSDTTWCDTDSCISANKCYCQRVTQRQRPKSDGGGGATATKKNTTPSTTSKLFQGNVADRNAIEKLALDYELFTINGAGKSLQPDEALSVKKSVEAAALFAHVKLSQTTDLKSMCALASTTESSDKSECNAIDYIDNKIGSPFVKHTCDETLSVDTSRRKKSQAATISYGATRKSHSADDLLDKLKSSGRKSKSKSGSVKSARAKDDNGVQLRSKASTEAEGDRLHGYQNKYQLMRVANASLEDSLGYLP